VPLRPLAPDASEIDGSWSAAPDYGPISLEPFDRRLDGGSGAPLAVAFSGGGDSLALLLAAKTWANAAGRPILALHVDHGLQPQSRAWAARARAVAQEVGADFRLLAWTGPKPVSGLPAHARAARLELMAEAARKAGARVLLLGHTEDDVREGDIMRAAGSSLGRLRDWSPSPVWPAGRGLFHFRPLLQKTRAALRAELAATGIDWIDDPANEDLRYARARARRGLTPDGVASDAPELPGDLGRLAAQAVFGPAGGVGITRGELGAAEAASARAFVQMALLCAAGTTRPPRGDSLDRLMGRLSTDGAFSATLCGAKVIAAGEDVLFARDAGEARRGGLRAEPLAPGAVQVWDGRFEITTGQPGLVVGRLAGRSAHLERAERLALRRIPAPLRPGLPVVLNAKATMTCPILADGPAAVRPLARLRLLSAAGLAATESQADALAHGANGSHVLFWEEQLKKASE
jgi:tRNA(Ile)-lysidine synthase